MCADASFYQKQNKTYHNSQIVDEYVITTYFNAALQSTVDKLLKKANMSLVVGTSSWREQFVEAVTVSAGKYA